MLVPQRVSPLIALLGSAALVAAGQANALEKNTDWQVANDSQLGEAPNGIPKASQAQLIQAAPSQTPPVELNLHADRQGFDVLANRFVAKGNVKLTLAGGRLLADKIEYESETGTLFAEGQLRFQRGNQYLQASRLRYSFIENSGEIEDVYGVLDLDSAALDLNPSQPAVAPLLPLSFWLQPEHQFSQESKFRTDTPSPLNDAVSTSLTATPLKAGTSVILTTGIPQPLLADDWQMPPVALSPMAQTIACPPPLPAIPDWHPEAWTATAWGGQMISANFGDTFFFNGRIRPEYLGGMGLNKRLMRAGPLALEFDSNAMVHHAYEQPGGGFNQKNPFSKTPQQTFGEFTWSFGVRAWLQPWLSLAFFEGVSLNTNVSNYEKTFRENYTTFLNYLGFELEALIKPKWSIVGRIHHRSGAYGTYSGVSEGSNAYLLGLRYRFGSAEPQRFSAAMSPTNGCPGSHPTRQRPLSDQLNQVVLGSAKQATSQPEITQNLPINRNTLAEQEKQRRKAIESIGDQRVNNLAFRQSLTVRRQVESNNAAFEYNLTDQEVTYGDARPWQLKPLTIKENRTFVTGSVSRWRMQASLLTVTPSGWQAERVAFTNDPFTPAQSWVDAKGVTARQEPNGDLVIQSSSNQLILEERLPIALQRNQRLEKKRDVENRWVMAVDSIDRDGFYLGYNLKTIDIGKQSKLSLQPQFMARRALDGTTSSYILPGQSVGDTPSSQPARVGDLFGLLARYDTRLFGLDVRAEGDFSTLDPSNFANGARSWGDISRSFNLPIIGMTTARGFATYRYRVWNGSLGVQDVYTAAGASLEQEKELPNFGGMSNRMFWRVGFGNYQGAEFESTSLADLWRANLYGSINSTLPLWTGKALNPGTPLSTRFSSTPVVPGLALSSNLNLNISYYGDGRNQQAYSISGGPTLTLGHLQKEFFDYTQLTVTGGGTLRYGVSPFAFDRIVDLSTLGLGLTQQLIGPLLISGGVGLNVDPSSKFYGDMVDSYVEVRWQRRAYELAVYYSPYQGIGGIRVKLNDFNFTGTGLPFVPYSPPGMAMDADIQRRGF